MLSPVEFGDTRCVSYRPIWNGMGPRIIASEMVVITGGVDFVMKGGKVYKQ